MLRFSTPPLSAETQSGCGSLDFKPPIFGSEKCQQDEPNVIASDTKGGARQSRNGFCGLLRHFIPRNDSRVFAFTLAEVLITLVIIGVVAALTIPNLMQKYTEQTTVKKLQKFYSNLSNAYNLAVKDNGPETEWGLVYNYNGPSAQKVYETLFKPYFKISKDCGFAGTGNCFGSEYKRLNNSVLSNYNTNPAMYKLGLDDGSAILVYVSSSISILFDVNGAKEPNTLGRDTFGFSVNNGKVVPNGIPPGTYDFNATCRSKTQNDYNSGGTGCAAWVVYKGNMDYLHCDGLTWAKHSCKDK